MKKMLAIAAVVASLVLQRAEAFAVLKTKDGGQATWNLRLAAGDCIHWMAKDGCPPIVRESAAFAAASWAEASGYALRFEEGPGGIEIEWETYHQPYLGAARLVFSGYDIVSARIAINGTWKWQREKAMGADLAAWTADLDALMLHEFGHCLGLDHADKGEIVEGSDLPTMWSYLLPGSETLSLDDVAGITFLYPSVFPQAPATDPPSANFYAKRLRVRQPVAFSVSPADDAAFWDFDDGTTAVGASPTHNFRRNGAYIVSVTSRCQKATVFVLIGRRKR
jgi:hypothetical protein